MKQVVFVPGQQSERVNCFDRSELLRPCPDNPILCPEYPWEGRSLSYPCVLYIASEEIYKMWYQKHMSYPQIAQSLNIPVKTVTKQIHVARRHIQEIIALFLWAVLS